MGTTCAFLRQPCGTKDTNHELFLLLHVSSLVWVFHEQPMILFAIPAFCPCLDGDDTQEAVGRFRARQKGERADMTVRPRFLLTLDFSFRLVARTVLIDSTFSCLAQVRSVVSKSVSHSQRTKQERHKKKINRQLKGNVGETQKTNGSNAVQREAKTKNTQPTKPTKQANKQTHKANHMGKNSGNTKNKQKWQT